MTETAGLAPTTAIDLGCGEGADAIWLATRGWRVTGVDVSTIAIERAGEAAKSADVAVDWICGDFVADPPAEGGFDLVTVHYPALRKESADAAIAAMTGAVAPGGILLFVAHSITDPEVPRSHGFEPDDYLDPADVTERLGNQWTVEVNETRPRETPGASQTEHTEDIVLKARRRG